MFTKSISHVTTLVAARLGHYSWSEVATRIVLHSEDYLDFSGQYSAGGRQRYIRDLAHVIRFWGREVLVVQKGVRDFETTCPGGVHVVGVKANLSAAGDFMFARRAARVANPKDLWLYASGESAWPFFAKNSKAVQHGVWWDGPQAIRTRLIQRQRALGMSRSVREVLCVDTNFINWLRQQGAEGYRLTAKCQYVHNYADLHRISPTTKTETDRLSLICARRFESKRGLEVFCRAVKLLRERGIDCEATLCVVGDPAPLEALTRSEGIDEAITITSESLDSVLSAYAHHHIAVVPTLWSEGTSLACVEALAAGVPVVASPVGGLGNLIVPGFNGALVNPDPEAIASAIAKIWVNGEWRLMSSNCLSMRESLSRSRWQKRVLDWLQR